MELNYTVNCRKPKFINDAHNKILKNFVDKGERKTIIISFKDTKKEQFEVLCTYERVEHIFLEIKEYWNYIIQNSFSDSFFENGGEIDLKIEIR